MKFTDLGPRKPSLAWLGSQGGGRSKQVVKLALQAARWPHSVPLAEQEASRLGGAVADREMNLSIAFVMLEYGLQFIDQGDGEQGRLDLDLEGAGRCARHRRRRGDFRRIGFEALGLLNDELGLAAVLVVKAAAH